MTMGGVVSGCVDAGLGVGFDVTLGGVILCVGAG